MPAPTTTALRRFRVSRGFGQAPRFVMASTALYARLAAWRAGAAA